LGQHGDFCGLKKGALLEVVWVNFVWKSDLEALLTGEILVSVGAQTGYA
jgi:hypothetical protein